MVLDSRRPDIGRLNHSSGSSFMTTTVPPSGQFTPQSNSYQPESNSQQVQIGQMAPLQPIRTQGAAGHTNLLELFDPLNEDLPTPPIRQGSLFNTSS